MRSWLPRCMSYFLVFIFTLLFIHISTTHLPTIRYGRVDNIDIWLEKNSNWNMERRSKATGATVLAAGIYLGQNKLKTVQRLFRAGANLSALNDSGGSLLIMACSSDDADPKVVRFLLDHKKDTRVNMQIASQTDLWRIRRLVCRCALRLGVTKSRLMSRVAQSGGLTALHYAARRGDMEIVELLLEYGADPFIKNDLGRDALS